jgi:hypothetical protein
VMSSQMSEFIYRCLERTDLLWRWDLLSTGYPEPNINVEAIQLP